MSFKHVASQKSFSPIYCVCSSSIFIFQTRFVLKYIAIAPINRRKIVLTHCSTDGTIDNVFLARPECAQDNSKIVNVRGCLSQLAKGGGRYPSSTVA